MTSDYSTKTGKDFSKGVQVTVVSKDAENVNIKTANGVPHVVSVEDCRLLAIKF